MNVGTMNTEMSVKEALEAMIEHSFDNPTHGYDCACKDKFIRAAKRSLALPKHARFENARVVQDNYEYLLHSLYRSSDIHNFFISGENDGY